ncbi:MAG: hypothetical protein ABIG89_05545 [Candidatus Woesearchaeota archaeon]
MWLIITLISTIIVSTIYLLLKDYRKRLRLGFLALMLWGTFLMVLVDHIIAFIGGEPFIEVITDGLIKNGTILGIIMIVPILIIWIISYILLK